MRGALYEFIFNIKKLIGLPVKGYTCMWALVNISVKLVMFMDYEYVSDFVIYFDGEFSDLFRGKVSGLA